MSWTTSEKFPAELSKLLSTCPVDHIENECHVFWNFRKLLNFSDKCLDLWLKFSAAFPNVHSSCPKYFFGFFVNGSHVCFKLRTQAKKILVLKKKFVIFVEIAFFASRELFDEFLSKTCRFFSLVWFFRQNLLNSRRKYFSSRQKCILSQNVPNFGENFQQNRQKDIIRVQRNTLTKTLLASRNKFHLWAKSFRICAGKFAGLLSYEHYLFADGQLEEYFCKNFYFS